ncbi:hypothetical protein FRC01_005336 [Tulasnella sp. 417]|nr:hypothetical protein FRC01_005336 [Tulasnella sp. 417]
MQTVVAHQAEIWSMDVDPVGELIFTGSTDGELKAWSVDSDALEEGVKTNESGELTKIINPVGSLPLTLNHRVSQISFHPFEPYLAVQSHERSVEIFNIRTEEEIKKKRARKKQRQREKQRKKQEKGKETAMDEEMDVPAEDENDNIGLTDLFSSYLTVRGSSKIRSFDFVNAGVTKSGIQILLALNSNALEICNVPRKPQTKSDEPPEVNRTYSLDLPGHRTDIRTLSLSSTDELLASGSNGSVKIWNMRTTACIRTLDCEYAICSTFLPGDRHLIVTCSADKNVKIWGLDFGDCHKSIFAHEESIMQVAFEKDSHYFWTVGKDKWVKYWDGDRFENIQKLDGHHGEIWALAVSNFGKFVVTGSHDKSIRVWEKLEDQLFLEEERERELEELYERGVVDSMNRSNHIPNQEGPGDESGPTEAESTTVNKQTADTLMAGEKIMEALEIADADMKVMQEYENIVAKVPPAEADKVPLPTRHAILTAYDLDGPAYVLKVVQAIQSTALHDALLVLPFSKVVSLMTYLNEWAIKDLNTPLISRILFFLLRTHHHQIVSNRTMRGVLVDLRTHLRDALKRQKDEISYNLAALQYVRQQHEANRIAHFYEQEDMDEAKVRARLAEGGKKRKRISVKA